MAEGEAMYRLAALLTALMSLAVLTSQQAAAGSGSHQSVRLDTKRLSASSSHLATQKDWAVPVVKSGVEEIISADGIGGVWVQLDDSSLVHVSKGGQITKTGLRPTSWYAFGSDGAGGIFMAKRWVDSSKVLHVDVAGDKRTLDADCSRINSLASDHSEGAWVACDNYEGQTVYKHLDLRSGRVQEFPLGDNVRNLWMPGDASDGGFWGLLVLEGNRYRLMHVDSQGNMTSDRVTYGWEPEVAVTGEGAVLPQEPGAPGGLRFLSAGFAYEQTTPTAFNGFDNECLDAHDGVCWGWGASIRWSTSTRKWQLQGLPAKAKCPCTVHGEDRLADGSHVYELSSRRGDEYWKSTASGLTYRLDTKLESPPAPLVASGQVAWAKGPTDSAPLYRVDPTRIPWRKAKARIQSVSIADWGSARSVALPSKSDQGIKLTWKLRDKGKCRISDGKLSLTKATCAVRVSAPGRGRWARLNIGPIFQRG